MPLVLNLSVENDPVLELSASVVAVGDLPYYSGPYAITPTLDGFGVPTKNRAMSNDMEVRPIPISKVSNVSGGYTYTIG